MNAILNKIEAEIEGVPERIEEARRLSDLVEATKLERKLHNLKLLQGLLLAFKEKRLDTAEIRLEVLDVIDVEQ